MNLLRLLACLLPLLGLRAADAADAAAQPPAATPYEASFVQARTLFQAGRLDEALAAAEAAQQTETNRWEPGILRATILLRAGRAAEARQALTATASRVPADKQPQVARLAQQIEAALAPPTSLPAVTVAPASTTPAARAPLTPAARRQLDVLKLIIEEADKAKLDTERKRLLDEFLRESEPFTQANPDVAEVWVLRAVAALELERERPTREADRELTRLGLDQSDDPKIRRVLAMIQRKKWLGSELAEIDRKAAEAERQIAEQAAENRRRQDAADQARLAEEQREREARAARQRADEDRKMPQIGISAGNPWINSLGMKFVPVPGTPVWFSVWETRVWDYSVYAAAATGVDGSWREVHFEGQRVSPTEDHPVVNVSWQDAQAFCVWLTEKERREGRLTPQQSYRLPTDAEWSRAVGLASERGSTPKARDGGVKDLFPWGRQWPPPRGAGNYADTAAKAKFSGMTVLDGYDDGFATTAPVGSFSANQHGLFDLGGNVWEWCEDYYDGSSGGRVLRGASFYCFDRGILLSSNRFYYSADDRISNIGIRLVLVGAGVR